MDQGVGDQVEPAQTKDMRPALVASMIGAIIEWYDYALYGTAAALVFGKAFFPNISPAAATMATIGTFSVGFIARPIGGLICGHFGDIFGRKSTLVMTLLTMGVATTLIGALPTYAQVGLLAPGLLILLRLLQGFAVGGAWGGSVLMVVESAPAAKRGMWGAWPQIGVSAGLVLGAAAFSLTAALTTEDQFLAWGWRVPFVVSIVLAGVGLFIRLRAMETPAFEKAIAHGDIVRSPVIEAARSNWKEVLLTFGSRFPDASNYYIFTVVILSFATGGPHIPRADAINCVMAGAAANVISMPFWGALSDRIGRKTVFMGGALFMAVFAWPFYAMIASGSTALMAAALIIMLVFGYGAAYAPLGAYLPELFPAKVRYSGISLGYQLAAVLLSGTAPLLASALLLWGDGSFMPLAVFTAVTAMIGFAAVALGPETRGRDLS
jgi:MFS family permease